MVVARFVARRPAVATGRPARHRPEQDAALQGLLGTYVVEFLRRNWTNTYLGGVGLDSSLADVDGTLRDYAPAALERRIAASTR